MPCSTRTLVLCLALLTACLPGCDRAGDSSTLPAVVQESPPPSGTRSRSLTADLRLQVDPQDVAVEQTCHVHFVDRHDSAGLNFVFNNGASPQKLMPQSTSGGAGWLDYDADGWYDLFLPQGGSLTTTQWADQPRDQLYRNRGDGNFSAVTGPSFLVDSQFGHGVAVGDFDNDGFDDIYVTNVGPDVLYRNLGDGTFEDVSIAAGIDSPHWSSSAAWGDLDRDGDLDLYVCNYVDYDPKHPIACLDEQGQPSTCNPTMVGPMPNLCYFNQGDGRFVESANERGLNASEGKALGVVIADFTGDGESDVYVANDTTANHLFVNQGKGRFVESALALGCALSGLGQAQASMGIGFGDYDRDGWPDLYLSHFTDDYNTLYRNLGPAGFTDETRAAGLLQPTLKYLGFGVVMADYDADGWQDLFVANGHIDDFRQRTGVLWYMPAQLFRYDGRRWQECTGHGGAYFEREWLGRAVASADYDRDGDLDLAVIHQNDPMALLQNESDRGHWMQIRFIGNESNRRGIGVKVSVTQNGTKQIQELPGGTSYCASHEPVLAFGFGHSEEPCEVTVTWPSGRQQTITEVNVNQSLLLRESEAERP